MSQMWVYLQSQGYSKQLILNQPHCCLFNIKKYGSQTTVIDMRLAKRIIILQLHNGTYNTKRKLQYLILLK